MSFNIIAYGIYFAIMAFIIGRVGWLFYHHGQIYVNRLFPEEPSYGQWLNKLLLKAYYLFNLGYVAMSISTWQKIENIMQLIEKLSQEIGTILLTLALMHYMNLLWLRLYSHWKHRQTETIIPNPRNYGSE